MQRKRLADLSSVFKGPQAQPPHIKTRCFFLQLRHEMVSVPTVFFFQNLVLLPRKEEVKCVWEPPHFQRGPGNPVVCGTVCFELRGDFGLICDNGDSRVLGVSGGWGSCHLLSRTDWTDSLEIPVSCQTWVRRWRWTCAISPGSERPALEARLGDKGSSRVPSSPTLGRRLRGHCQLERGLGAT